MHIKKRQIPEALEEAYALFQRGAMQQSKAILTAIVKADHRQPDALHILGLIEGREGAFAAAENTLTRAIKIAPDVAEYHNSLGVILRKQGKLREAERCYHRCLKLEPGHAEALDNLGTLMRHAKRPEEAEQYCRQAVMYKPSDEKVRANLAGCLAEQGRIVEPLHIFRQLALSTCLPIKKNALTALMNILRGAGETAEYVQLHRQVLDERDAGYALSTYLFSLNYLDSIDKTALADQHRKMAARIQPSLTLPVFSATTADAGKKQLRIGYLSPDIIFGSVGMLIEPIIQAHDKTRIFTVIYDVHPKEAEPLETVRMACDLWRECRSMSNNDLVNLIRNDTIDILVDLAGHCDGNRLPVFAMRAAPIQVSWLGYFNSTGLQQMDWIISDQYSTPAGDEKLYTERVWRMPHFRFAVTLKQFQVGQAPQKSAGAVTFITYNNILKLSYPLLKAWARIVDQLPDSVLLLRWTTVASDEIKQVVRDRFVAAGIKAEQLRLADPIVEHDEFMASYADGDIMLDSFPFCGGITSLDALSAGIPVVTLPGDRMAGQQTRAFLELSGHPELVASSWDEYVNIAVKLANDPQRLRHMRATLRDDLLQSRLCDVVQFTGDLENAYRTIWETWCREN